jgi:acetylornithine deacetylase/succinyl-diaminopimelate desuccinylase-like protein
MSHLLAVCFSLALASSLAFAQPLITADESSIRRAAVATFPEFLDFLSLPNDPKVSGDALQKNAAWLQSAFAKRGFQTRLLENREKPLVFAEFVGNRPGRKTILFYLHFDGQPVIPSQWSQKDPWRPVLKRRGVDGTWSEVEMAQLMRSDFDPEIRLFGRSVSDDKGPILMFLATFDLLASQKINPAINVKVLLDSEEELNSPGMPVVVAAQARLLQADALVIHDGPLHASGRPTLVFGNRGLVPVTLTVFGPRNPLHSGHYGNYVPNPALRLAALLATMKDEDGRVTVPGYYDRTRLTPEERKVLAEVPDDEAALWKRVGIASPEKVGATYQEALQYPSLNVRGLASAGVGEKAANIVPHQAVAELDLRTTPEADAAYLLGLLKKHIESQGYHLVQGEPTAEDRVRYPKLARLEPGQAAAAARAPYDSTLGGWASSVLEGVGRAKPVRIRMMGGTVPTYEIVTPLHLPFVLIPLANADNNQHTFDENLRMGNYLSGMRTMLGLLTTPYPEAN